MAWWALLVSTGWAFFLPGILDRLKFTDGLVGHSIMAMAGFASSLLILILGVLLDQDAVFQHISADASPEQFRTEIARIARFGLQGTNMPGHEYLPDEQIAAIADYVADQRKAPRK